MNRARCKLRHSAAWLTSGVLALVLAGFLAPVWAAEPTVRLVGIVTLPNESLALLERESVRPWRRDLLLASGQTDGEIAVLEINAAGGSVKLKIQGTTHELAFAAATPTGRLVQPAINSEATAGRLGSRADIRLEQAGLRQVFALYQRLAERNLIRPTALPEVRLELYSREQVTIADVLRGIEQALLDKGITLKPDGDKFVVAGQAKTWIPLCQGATLRLSPAASGR